MGVRHRARARPGASGLTSEAGRAWDRNYHIDVTPLARGKRENPSPAKAVQVKPAATRPALGSGARRHGNAETRGEDDEETPPWHKCSGDWRTTSAAESGYISWDWCDS